MKLKVQWYFLSLLIFVVSCNQNLSSSKLERHFTESQIEDLNKINNFFISEILKSDSQNFLIALNNFLNDCRTKGIDAVYNPLKVEDFEKVLNSISKSTFNEIWKLNTVEDKTKYKWLAPKYNGKYQMFLKDIGKKNEIVKKYYDRMKASGDYNPIHFDESLVNSYKKMDYDSKQIQIILAIHYFSVIYDYLNSEKTFT